MAHVLFMEVDLRELGTAGGRRAATAWGQSLGRIAAIESADGNDAGVCAEWNVENVTRP